jgi:methylase of polypeptide subunit release factors
LFDQVESFALLLWQLTQQVAPTSSSAGSASKSPTLQVVEFGSGSGNLILPLAHLFPHFAFTAVDMKPSAVQLLQQRVQDAGLHNVAVQLGRIEDYTGMVLLTGGMCDTCDVQCS